MKKKWSDNLRDHPSLFRNHSVTALFRMAARSCPEQTAVVSCEESICYGELETRSNCIAAALLKAGVQPGEIVMLSTGRTVNTIASILAVWKIGCAYVYLETYAPDKYNEHIRMQCGDAFDVTPGFLQEALRSGTPEDNLEEYDDPDRRAVIIYTSGSTRQPKGVILSHRSLAASASNLILELGVDSSDRYAGYASLMFVAGAADVSATLSAGCTLYLFPVEICRNISKVAQYYCDNQITVTFLPPHMAAKYMNMPQSPFLKLLLVGSEPARNLRKQNYDIVNVYASSEGSSIITCYRIQDSRTEYPIGWPMPTFRCYIVDDKGQQVQKGEKGELWVAGRQLFDGYLGQEGLSRSRILPNPFSDDPDFARVYRTSDIVYEAEEGLMYCGRTDHMVKVRGFRIELNFVENLILRYPGIREVCCTVFKDSGGTNILFAFYISDTDIDHRKLRHFLKEEMPYYMVPTGLIRCGDFPRTPSGKAARNLLSVPPELDDHKLLKKIYY